MDQLPTAGSRKPFASSGQIALVIGLEILMCLELGSATSLFSCRGTCLISKPQSITKGFHLICAFRTIIDHRALFPQYPTKVMAPLSFRRGQLLVLFRQILDEDAGKLQAFAHFTPFGR